MSIKLHQTLYEQYLYIQSLAKHLSFKKTILNSSTNFC